MDSCCSPSFPSQSGPEGTNLFSLQQPAQRELVQDVLALAVKGLARLQGEGVGKELANHLHVPSAALVPPAPTFSPSRLGGSSCSSVRILWCSSSSLKVMLEGQGASPTKGSSSSSKHGWHRLWAQHDQQCHCYPTQGPQAPHCSPPTASLAKMGTIWVLWQLSSHCVSAESLTTTRTSPRGARW